MSFAWLILRATVQYHTIVESRRGLRPVPVLLKIIIVRQKSRSNFIKYLQKYTPSNLTYNLKIIIINIGRCSLCCLINRQDQQQIMLNYCISVLWQRMCQPSQRHLTAIEKKYGEKHLVFYSGYIATTFFSISTREVFIVQGVPLSKHITHYGPWTSFPYYKHTTPTSNKI